MNIRVVVAMGLLGLVRVEAAEAGETRSFAIKLFKLTGHYYAKGEDCPEGFNIHGTMTFVRHKLSELGYTDGELRKLLEGNDFAKAMDILTNRGRNNGMPVNVYSNPESVPDPRIKTGQGRYGYGFNLDGKIKPGDFADPESGEQGIDNNLYRVVACSPNVGRVMSPLVRPRQQGGGASNQDLQVVPAQLIEVRNIDSFENDDDVLVGNYMSLDSLAFDASGEPAAYKTMRVDPDPRWSTVVHGKITAGVLTTAPFDLNIKVGITSTALKFKQTRLRLQFAPNGELWGVLGGYESWQSEYRRYSVWGTVPEIVGLDMPGYYHALKRLADAYPDAKTGQNTMISAGYDLEAVPALITRVSPVASLAKRP